MPLDPSNPSSQKITHGCNQLISTEVKDFLEFFSTSDNIGKTIVLPQGLKQCRLIPAIMEWNTPKMA
jgi:hypothetical protein